MSLHQRDQEILHLNQTMLESVVRGDWHTYAQFCNSDLTCFEAETNGVLVEGMDFHKFYFDLASNGDLASTSPAPSQVTMAASKLRWLSEDAVVVSYTRLTQKLIDAEPITASCCETRIWQRQQGQWKQVHVHRS